MTADSESLGARLRRLRQKARLTQQQLATAAGLAITSLAQIERGAGGDPRLSTLLALAGTLGVDPAVLVKGLPAAAKEKGKR